MTTVAEGQVVQPAPDTNPAPQTPAPISTERYMQILRERNNTEQGTQQQAAPVAAPAPANPAPAATQATAPNPAAPAANPAGADPNAAPTTAPTTEPPVNPWSITDDVPVAYTQPTVPLAQLLNDRLQLATPLATDEDIVAYVDSLHRREDVLRQSTEYANAVTEIRNIETRLSNTDEQLLFLDTKERNPLLPDTSIEAIIDGLDEVTQARQVEDIRKRLKDSKTEWETKTGTLTATATQVATQLTQQERDQQAAYHKSVLDTVKGFEIAGIKLPSSVQNAVANDILSGEIWNRLNYGPVEHLLLASMASNPTVWNGFVELISTKVSDQAVTSFVQNNIEQAPLNVGHGQGYQPTAPRQLTGQEYAALKKQ